TGDAQIQEDLAYRRRTQPWDQPNLGSTFKNPPHDHAARLLEAAGLKGRRIGDVAFSDRHANFLVNLGGGRARDARALVDLAVARVREQSGVTLETEIREVGES
ncbi:MAG: UDP-N-acetylmuramate dehydrogenase, partial [Deltaproteobacteria bacterium]